MSGPRRLVLLSAPCIDLPSVNIHRLSIAILVLLGILILPRGAAAHALLVESVPADGAVIDSRPEKIILRFNEAIKPVAIELQNDAGDEVRGNLCGSGREMCLEMAAPLPAAGYRIRWRVIGADSHPAVGIAVFRVGRGPIPSKGSSDQGWLAARVLQHAARNLALLIAVGCVLFDLLVSAVPRRLIRLTAVTGSAFAVLGMLISLGEVGLQGWPLVQDAAIAAGLGLISIAANRSITVPGAMFAVLALALTGHLAALPVSSVPSFVLPFHLLSAAFWAGSLLALWIVLWREAAMAATVKRFSEIAVVGAVILILSGSYLAFEEVGSLTGLITTAYGLTVIAKSGVVVVLLCIAAYNKYRLTPLLPRSATALRRTIDIELVMIVVLTTLSGLLAELPPAILICG